jgi:hypothetical protein
MKIEISSNEEKPRVRVRSVDFIMSEPADWYKYQAATFRDALRIVQRLPKQRAIIQLKAHMRSHALGAVYAARRHAAKAASLT